MYKWFLAWRYLRTKMIAFFGIASVMLCVAMVLVVMSVMGGFLDTVRDRSRGLHSEIIIDNRSMQGFPYYEEFSRFIENRLPEVIRLTTPSIWTYGLFRIPATNFTVSARVQGIHLDDYVQLNDFKRGLHYERYFPGTTTFKPQGMPVVGIGENGVMTLPPDLAAANALWRSNETDAAAIEAFDRLPFERALLPRVRPFVPAERVFAVDVGEAGYRGSKRPGIIVGCDLLNIRRSDGNFDRVYARGTDVALTLIPLSPAGNPNRQPAARLALRYVDDSRSGIYEIDSMSVYVDADMLQRELAMDAQPLAGGGFTKPRVNQLLVGLHEGVDMNEAKALITDAWREFYLSLGPGLTMDDERALAMMEVSTWEDLQRPFIQAVEKEKVLVTILFSLISMVAIVLVGCIFYMIVEKKTRDIGILKAIGASGRGVAVLFVSYAGAVGVLGSILGIALGSFFVWNINDIQDFLASLDPQLRVWSPDIYSFDRIPEVVKRADAIWIGLIAVFASMVGSLIPAFVAARVWPVQALRYE